MPAGAGAHGVRAWERRFGVFSGTRVGGTEIRMLTITLHDLRFRARQFVIAVVGAGLVFAMALLLAGMAAGFDVEINQTIEGMGGQAWVVAAGSVPRIAALSPIPEKAVTAVAHTAGVTRADPVIVVPQAAIVGAKPAVSVNLIGYRPGGLGGPGEAVTGHPLTARGQVVVDSRLKLGVGRSLTVAGRSFTVVGVVQNRTLLGGVADVYVSLADAQDIVFGGRPLVGAVLTTGVPRSLPPGYRLATNAQVEKASQAQMASAISSINNSRLFMWMIAAIIVAALVYVTALERTRDFAVLKAVGSSTSVLFAGLAAQAVAVALVAAIVAAILSSFMGGIFAQPVDIPAVAFVELPLSAVIVGLLASLAALRRAASVDPSAAFAGA
jgi:putative ABC transport system permease protein